MTYALFDVESRIDKELIRRCRYPQFEASAAGAEEAYQVERAAVRELQRLPQDADPFMPLQWHVPISISVGVVDSDDYALSNLETLLSSAQAPSTIGDYEREIVEIWWARAEKFRLKKGVFVGFNSRGFDFPLLQLHALRHGCAIPTILDERYGSNHRYQTDAHLDLLDYLTNFGAVHAPKGGLGFYLRFLGYAGKSAITGADVQRLYEENKLAQVQAYNRNDVRRLYQLFLRVQAMRGQLDASRAAELAAGVEMEPE
jgi:predicted PolB exonuclease-like 3'-5' exonuclease